MLPYLSLLIASEHPWNFSRSSGAEILEKGVWQWSFLSMCVPRGPRFLFLFSLWLILQLTRCCGSLPICFFSLLSQWPHSLCKGLLFLSSTYLLHFSSILIFKCLHPDVILQRLSSSSRCVSLVGGLLLWESMCDTVTFVPDSAYLFSIILKDHKMYKLCIAGFPKPKQGQGSTM